MPKYVLHYTVWDRSENCHVRGTRRETIEEAQDAVAVYQAKLSWFQRLMDWLHDRSTRYEVGLETELVWEPHEHIED